MFLIIFTPDGYFLSFGLYTALILSVGFIAKIPVLYVLSRLLIVAPFALTVSIFVPFTTAGTELTHFQFGALEAGVTVEGVIRFGSIVSRALIMVLAVTVLVAVTRFEALMYAARSLKAPAGLIEIMSFMYRYLFIIIDEAGHMLLARSLRSNGSKQYALRSTGGIIGALFVRSFEHADRLHSAMLVRGFSGEMPSLAVYHVHRTCIIMSLFFLTAAGLALQAGWFIHG
jgi:cobalt/nickel transport system permease protein